MITFADFERVDVRVGRIVRADRFRKHASPPTDCRSTSVRRSASAKSSAQLTTHYEVDDLEGRLVLGVVNFPPRQIGPFMSEVLTLGVPDENGAVVLVVPDEHVPMGGKLF